MVNEFYKVILSQLWLVISIKIIIDDYRFKWEIILFRKSIIHIKYMYTAVLLFLFRCKSLYVYVDVFKFDLFDIE